jgi:hypothetical protein
MVRIAAMHYHEHWIKGGQLLEPPKDINGVPLADRELLFKHDFVKVECGHGGTHCKWVMFGANWLSLYFVKEFIAGMIEPFTLEFFNAGWFSEKFDTALEARKRLEQLISKSDVRFSTRTFTRSFEPQKTVMPKQLHDFWLAGEIDEESAVYCSVEEDREQTQVEYIGENSALAKVWGVSPVSYPCRSGHSYDRVVSKSYFEVVKTNRPHYDHVLAAMVRPDGVVQWLGYHRLILPHPTVFGRLPTVAVACEFAEVDIPLL